MRAAGPRRRAQEREAAAGSRAGSDERLSPRRPRVAGAGRPFAISSGVRVPRRSRPTSIRSRMGKRSGRGLYNFALHGSSGVDAVTV